jgi:penicillin-binding protein 1C
VNRPALRRTGRRVLVLTLGLMLLLALLTTAMRLLPHPPLKRYAPSSTAVYDRHGTLLRLTLARDERYRLWTPLEDVPPDVVQALLLHEDRRFYWHWGIDPGALVRAVVRTTTGWGRKQGGSTLTMQLARLIWGLNTRTVKGKLTQIVRAVQLEMRYSKREILEAHLNLMPYGHNIEGVGAASLIHFGKPVRHVTLSEALTLVVIPQAPTRRRIAGQDHTQLQVARERLFAKWLAAYPGAAKHAQLMRQPMALKGPSQLPFRAPHAVQQAVTQTSAGDVTLTLDLRQQTLVETQVAHALARMERVGIGNATAMLVDTRDMGVRALVGSANFFDEEQQGQVNGTLARRSPGSALKPFVYALALDQGVIHSKSVLKDAPTSFGEFNPENFDRQFAGPIDATQALVRSRNVPAVELAARIAKPGLYELLKTAGVGRLKPEPHYGLALALGSGEVSMEELVTLYAMLANGGQLKPLVHRLSVSAQRAAHGAPQLLSAEAAYTVLDMLESNPRPDQSSLFAVRALPIAWKTGTSWGFRDAWSVGVIGPYVLAVWVGNFDGSGNPALVGVDAAAPLFFQIADALMAAEPALAQHRRALPARLKRIEVCAASGDLPNEHCPVKTAAWFIPGVSPIRESTLHQLVRVDRRTGRQACDNTDPNWVDLRPVEVWPSDLARVFAQAGMPRTKPPAAALPTDCHSLEIPANRTSSGHGVLVAASPPRITSPTRTGTYVLQAGAQEHIALAAITDGAVNGLHWFVDGAYVGEAQPGKALAWVPAAPGRYKVRAVDSAGQADAREVSVVWRE